MSATNRRKLQRAEARKHARTAARLVGCICRPDLRHRADGRVTVLHDDWCPATNAPSMLVVFTPKGCDR